MHTLRRTWYIVGLGLAAAYVITAGSLPFGLDTREMAGTRAQIRNAVLLIDPGGRTPFGIADRERFLHGWELFAVWALFGLIVALLLAVGCKGAGETGFGMVILGVIAAVYLLGPWLIGGVIESQHLDDFRNGEAGGACERGVDNFRPVRLGRPPDSEVTATGDAIVSYCPRFDYVLALQTDESGTSELWRSLVLTNAEVVGMSPQTVMVDTQARPDAGLVGLNPASGETAWTFPYAADRAWYFSPDASPEVVQELVTETFEGLEPDGPDTPALVAAPQVTSGDPAAARAFLQQRYGLPDINGRLLVLCTVAPDPGLLVLLDPATGSTIWYYPIDPYGARRTATAAAA
jgi:hypothetical protein